MPLDTESRIIDNTIECPLEDEHKTRRGIFYSGLIRLHILHHAVEGPIFGLSMAEELGRHGYEISAGTLYPLLHRLMETKGYLRSSRVLHRKSFRKVYSAASLGQRAVKAAKAKVRELFGELIEGQSASETASSALASKILSNGLLDDVPLYIFAQSALSAILTPLISRDSF